VKTLYLVAIGNVPERVMEWIENATAEWFPVPTRRLEARAIPENAYDAKRKQYQSVEIMKMLSEMLPADSCRLLGVTEVDLAIPMLSFLFGQAQVDGPVALVSLCRLRQEFYGLQADEEALRARVTKEVLHELGHTFGLVHCNDPKCAMSLATHIQRVDEKQERFCERCGTQLVEAFSWREAEVS
jgi:archaemetzincin